MATTKSTKKKPNSALAAAASRKLARIGTPQGTHSPDEIAHAMFHAEQRGDAERVTFEDGTWGWQLRTPDGKVEILRPTPEIVAAVERFDDSHHH
jgi:hypothetical protein